MREKIRGLYKIHNYQCEKKSGNLLGCGSSTRE
jgi:hypothetical protein